MFRKKISRGRSRKMFSGTAKKVHRKNFPSNRLSQRGGIRL